MLKFLVLMGLTCSVSLSIAQTNVFPSSGNVGIGTLNPENAEGWDKVLEIYGTAHSKLLVSAGDIRNGMWSNLGGYYGAPAGGITGTLSNHPFSIVTNRSPKVTVMPNGNIGIGTIAPTDLLEINLGAVRRGITMTGDGNADAYADIQLAVSNKASVAVGKPHIWNISHRKDGYFSDTPIGESSLEFYAVRTGGGYFAPLSFKSNGDVILASNKNALNGNVGIGTTTPREKLSVNGNIRAKEIKVETQNWPDYVFKSDYSLPSLEATEKHIKEKGHLPGIPSAAEVKADGVEVGDMNAKLLKKIEELTLYLIEQKKELVKQSKEIQDLKSKIK
jgi:hypothetical protein